MTGNGNNGSDTIIIYTVKLLGSDMRPILENGKPVYKMLNETQYEKVKDKVELLIQSPVNQSSGRMR